MITGEQAAALIRGAVAEALFDVKQREQAEQLTFTCFQQDSLESSLALINTEHALQATQQVWDAWCRAGLKNCSPNLAPIVQQPEQLQRQVSPSLYQTLVAIMDGKRTLRDLAILMRKDLLVLTQSLMPYIHKGTMGLVAIPDLASPKTSTDSKVGPKAGSDVGSNTGPKSNPAAEPGRSQVNGPNQSAPNQSNPNQPISNQPTGDQPQLLIACVDDSPMDCRLMESILLQSGYQFVGIQDPLQALPILLETKPNLIFLDLVMPIASGYEICAQIRRVSIFKKTPVIILTGNDGIVDRVRAKVVGSSDFLAKPIEAQRILTLLRKYLPLPTSAQKAALS
ncbi:response regulator [Leptolyngbya sp. FACHB-261]|nr:response regulator [Leptolyngbya sp. FACHB-261]